MEIRYELDQMIYFALVFGREVGVGRYHEAPFCLLVGIGRLIHRYEQEIECS